LVIFLNLIPAGLRLGLKNYQVGEKWILDDYLYLCKGLYLIVIFYSACPNAIFKNKSNNLAFILIPSINSKNT